MAPKQAQKKASADKKVAKKIEKKPNTKNNKNRDEGMVSADVEIDEDARVEGTVDHFDKRRGFGFIKPEKKGLVPDDKLMVIWKEIQSDDRWPALDKGMKVEFNIKKFVKRNGDGAFIKAQNVTMPGGDNIALQSEQEDKKEYVGGDKNLRYTGNVVWYDFQKGFGFIKIEQGFEVPEDMPEELRVHREEIVVPEKESAHLRDGQAVEFGISKNKSGKYAVYHLTLPGGDPVSRAAFENRKEQGNKTFNGTIRSFMGGFGWIEPDSLDSFPAAMKKALEEFTDKRSKKAGSDKDKWVMVRREDIATDIYVDRGQKCTFKLYTGDKGIGAHSVDVQA